MHFFNRHLDNSLIGNAIFKHSHTHQTCSRENQKIGGKHL